MRFKYDIKKSEQLRKNPKRGVGFDEVQELFEHYYYEDMRCDDPTQYSATGWVQPVARTECCVTGKDRHTVERPARSVHRESCRPQGVRRTPEA